MPHTMGGTRRVEKGVIAMKLRGAVDGSSGNISGPSRKRPRRHYHRRVTNDSGA
jgi:hypothetical protein